MYKGTRCRVFQSEILFVSKGIKELNVEELNYNNQKVMKIDDW